MTEEKLLIPRPKRGEGQWGLGYLEPLNPAERIKRDLDGLKVRELVEGFSRGGFRSIDKASLRSRLRWWGLYTQRKQGIPGGGHSTMEGHELEDEFFMMRIRIEGGMPVRNATRGLLGGYATSHPQWNAFVYLLPYAQPEPSEASWELVRWMVADMSGQLFSSFFTAEQIPDLLQTFDQTAAEVVGAKP